MKEEKMYSIAVRKRDGARFWETDACRFSDCCIPCNGRYWLADPFLFEKDGTTYLFYEAYDLAQRTGKIGFSTLDAEGKGSAPQIIIEEKFHMSFPFIFEHEGEIYIMPETSENNDIALYRATSFPYKWERAGAVMSRTFACDSIILDAPEGRFLLESEMFSGAVPGGRYASCYVRNVLYEMEGLSVKGSGTPVSEGDFGIRNAGAFIREDGALYRMGQDCRDNRYGRGLVLYKVDSALPYAERQVWAGEELGGIIEMPRRRDVVGVHTYNSAGSWEVIDYSYMQKPECKIWFLRRWFKYTGKIKKLICG